MSHLTDRISTLLRPAPAWVRDLAVTAGSTQLLRHRRSGIYRQKRDEYAGYRGYRREDLLRVQREKLQALIAHAVAHSKHYRKKYQGVDTSVLRNLPILEKDELQSKIGDIVIGDRSKLEQRFTGGTTGRGIVVFNEPGTMQEHAALMDLFWRDHGFEIGRDRIAWLSGRSLIEKADERSNRFWRTNWLYKIRYYSTFHFEQKNLSYYLDDLERFQPRFMSGFPSAISEIARFADSIGRRLNLPLEKIFVTSETLLDEQRRVFERVFGCPVANQYSSSEGAPFIFECPRGSLHIDVTTGVFEVIDENEQPAVEGEMLVTGFFSRETPIIRYRIGDRLRLADRDKRCECGWQTPLAEAILGRLSEYIEIPGRGRIYNSQIGDCVKDVTSMVSFQVEVVDGRLQVYLIADKERFERTERMVFLKKVHERMGDIPVDIHFVDSIPRAASGKQSLVRRSSQVSP